MHKWLAFQGPVNTFNVGTISTTLQGPLFPVKILSKSRQVKIVAFPINVLSFENQSMQHQEMQLKCLWWDLSFWVRVFAKLQLQLLLLLMLFQTNVFKTSRKSRLVVAVKTRNGTVAFYHDKAGWQTETLGLSQAEFFIKHLRVRFSDTRG